MNKTLNKLQSEVITSSQEAELCQNVKNWRSVDTVPQPREGCLHTLPHIKPCKIGQTQLERGNTNGMIFLSLLITYMCCFAWGIERSTHFCNMFWNASVASVSIVTHSAFLSFSHAGFTMICRRIHWLSLCYCLAFVWKTDVKGAHASYPASRWPWQNSVQVTTFQHSALATRLNLFFALDGYFQCTDHHLS